jgi:hypothetical protein
MSNRTSIETEVLDTILSHFNQHTDTSISVKISSVNWTKGKKEKETENKQLDYTNDLNWR